MKRIRLIAAALSLVLLLGGCTMPSGDDLLTAPQPLKNYQTLQTELEKLLSSGLVYTAPATGDNRTTVQLIDLDADGQEEVISFFRGSTAATSNIFQIYVYEKQDEQYVCTGSIEGRGREIYSVDFPVITAEGKRGMVVSWNLSSEGTRALTMCDFDQNGAPRVLLETEYAAMELTDLTIDGAKDVLCIASTADGKRVARLYEYANGNMELLGEASVSADAVSIERVTTGRVADYLPAVFVEEKTAGGIGLTTDIFVYSGGTLRNLAMDGEDLLTNGTYRPVAVYAADINMDGVIELPRAVLMAGYQDASASDAVYMIDWYTYSDTQAPVRVQTTYHNVSENWYFCIDDAWHDKITAVKAVDGSVSMVQFYEYIDGVHNVPLFTIYCATGTVKDVYAERTDLIQLAQTAQAVYFARLADTEGQQSSIQIDSAGIASRFALTKQDWNN